MSEYWKGWRIRDENIISPEGWLIDRNTALSVPLMHQQIAQLRRQVRELEERIRMLTEVEEQPNPGQWELSEKIIS